MQKETKCPDCGHWNQGSQERCSSCNSLLDRNLYRKEKLEAEGKLPVRKVKKPDWLDRYLERTAQSNNPMVMFARGVITVAWIMYMGMISFILWLIAWLAG